MRTNNVRHQERLGVSSSQSAQRKRRQDDPNLESQSCRTRPRLNLGDVSQTLLPRSIQNSTSDELLHESDTSCSQSNSQQSQRNATEQQQRSTTELGTQSRAFDRLPETQQDLARRAGNIIREYTLFEQPMLKAQDLLNLIESAWSEAEDRVDACVQRDRITQTWLKSIHSRTRSHLVYDCKRSVIEIYGLKGLQREELKDRIENLLEGDRFTCLKEQRDSLTNRFRATEIAEIIFLKYFAGPKMRGNRDGAFLKSINGVFLCLTCTAIQHCLKAWRTGEYEEPPDFKYENSNISDTFVRMRNTFQAYPRQIRQMLLDCLKADLERRSRTVIKLVPVENTGAHRILDNTADLLRDMENELRASQCSEVEESTDAVENSPVSDELLESEDEEE